MRVVGVGIDVADGDRLDPLGLEEGDRLLDVPLAQGRQHAAVEGDPFGHLPAQVARDEGAGLGKHEVEEVGPVAARDLENVAEPLRRQQGGLRALALGERVDDRRGAVDERLDAPGVDAALFDDVDDPSSKLGGVVWLLAR